MQTNSPTLHHLLLLKPHAPGREPGDLSPRYYGNLSSHRALPSTQTDDMQGRSALKRSNQILHNIQAKKGLSSRETPAPSTNSQPPTPLLGFINIWVLIYLVLNISYGWKVKNEQIGTKAKHNWLILLVGFKRNKYD